MGAGVSLSFTQNGFPVHHLMVVSGSFARELDLSVPFPRVHVLCLSVAPELVLEIRNTQILWRSGSFSGSSGGSYLPEFRLEIGAGARIFKRSNEANDPTHSPDLVDTALLSEVPKGEGWHVSSEHGLSCSLSVSSSRRYLPEYRLEVGARARCYKWLNDAIDSTNRADLMEITLSGAFPTRSKGEDWPVFYLGRGLALPPFQVALGFVSCPTRAISDLGASILLVFDIPISWVPDLEVLPMPTPTLTPGSLGESRSPVLAEDFIGGRFMGHGCVRASVPVTSGRSSIKRSRSLGVRKISLDFVCNWGPNPTKDTRSIWNMRSLKREVPRTGLRAGLGCLPPVLGMSAVHARFGISDANDASSANADPDGFSPNLQVPIGVVLRTASLLQQLAQLATSMGMS